MLRSRGAGLWPTASRPGCPPVGLAPAAPLVTAPLAVAPPEKAAHEPTQSSHLRAGAAASVRRSLLGGVEPITSLHEVVHPTHHRQYDCNAKQARCQPTRLQDHRDYGHHLAGCLCLSPLARRDDHVLGGSYHAQTVHSELSSSYHHSNPCGHVAEVHQGDQRRRDQELVGQGIQKRSQHRSLASATGEIAVQRISYAVFCLKKKNKKKQRKNYE